MVFEQPLAPDRARASWDTGAPGVSRPAEPLDLGRGPVWPNRLVLAPLTNRQSNADGSLHDDELRWLRQRAVGGFGVVMTCAAHATPEGQAFPGQLAVWDDRFLPGLQRVAAALKDNGAVSAVQLHHGGCRAKKDVSGLQPVAPWDDEGRGVRALTTPEVKAVVRRFAEAARRVESAGFDGVEIHGAHGYLLAQFLDPIHNLRRDEYGGSLENRSRIVFEVLRAVRAATGPDFQVGLRLSPARFGIVLGEALVLAERVMASGLIDYLDMSLWDVGIRSEEPGHGGRTFTELFAELPRAGVKLGVAGKVATGATAQWCLDNGADFVLVGTGAILQHDFAARVIADPGFESVPQPVAREHLEAQAIGPKFIEYLATSWDDFVC